jgi:nicotinate-nucleotide pyrophosphorylase (carboxylating)
VQTLSIQDYTDIIDRALAEDHADQDITSLGCVAAEYYTNLVMIGRTALCVAGLPVVAAVFQRLDPAVMVENLIAEAENCLPGQPLVRVTGRAHSLLAAERVALNMLQFMSSIATHTARLCAEISHTSARLRDTRKTIPGLRSLSKYAVTVGGGVNHRFSLGDGVLIKDNHLAMNNGSMAQTVAAMRAATTLPIQVECDTLVQVMAALDAGVDQILLDNMSPDLLRQAVILVNGRVPLEASGGMGLHNIRAVAETGVDFISAGCITQSPPAVDIGLDWQE